jgi:hypothetical protein
MELDRRQTLRRTSNKHSTMLFSSTSPPSNNTSVARSRIHPGMTSLPIPVPVCCDSGGVTDMCNSVAVDFSSYTPYNADIRGSIPRSPSSDSPISLLGGTELPRSSYSLSFPLVPAEDDMENICSRSMSSGSPTKQHRVLISSMTSSVKIS